MGLGLGLATGWQAEAESVLSSSLSALSAVSPAEWCRGFFLLAAVGVLGAAATPPQTRALLADYGARKVTTTTATTREKGKEKEAEAARQQQDPGWFITLIATVTAWGQVPHSWFTAFYGLSLACSAFWLVQYLSDGSALRSIASRQVSTAERSATLLQVVVAWVMMVLQAGRRIYEHATIIRPSSSTMWFVHWMLGLAFYLFVSVSVWVEGSSAISNGHISQISTTSSLKILLATPLFLYAWVNQYRCHAHLAGLKKYSLPTAGLFRHFICPHYTCECLLYLSLAIAAAPEGELYNKTLLCGVVFVLVNLGVTASGTRHWYAAKFGEAAVAQKWNMVPFIF